MIWLPAMLLSATVIGQSTVAGEHHRKEKVVPGGGELPDQHDDKTGDGDGQQNLAIDAQHVSAVDFGGFEQFLRHAGIIVAEGEGGDGDAVDDVGHDQRRDAAQSHGRMVAFMKTTSGIRMLW